MNIEALRARHEKVSGLLSRASCQLHLYFVFDLTDPAEIQGMEKLVESYRHDKDKLERLMKAAEERKPAGFSKGLTDR